MAQDTRQGNVNAEVIAAMMKQMGENIAEGIKSAEERKIALAKLEQSSMEEVNRFRDLPAAQRQRLLADPSFVAKLVRSMDPETFMDPRKAKKLSVEDWQNRVNAVKSMGLETPEETAKRQSDQAAADKARAEADIAQRRAEFATGKRTASPMDLITNFDFKDPIAATMATMVPPDQLRDIALAKEHLGPIYQQSQQQEWFKWGIDQGMSPGQAMAVAVPISQGKWDQVPSQWRGKAEQNLSMDLLNANSRRMEVNNTIANSLAVSASDLAQKAGIPLDQARANIVALRQGKPVPYPTPHLEEMAAADELIKRQEIQKNASTILNDKSGVSVIRESLNTMLSEYKEGTGSRAEQKDLANKITALQHTLAERLGSYYGVSLPSYGNTLAQDISGFSDSVVQSMGQVWNAMKTSGAWAGENLKAIDAVMATGPSAPTPTSSTHEFGEVSLPVPGLKPPPAKLTDDQTGILKQLYQSLTDGINNPDVPDEQKKSMSDYITNTLDPVTNGAAEFNSIFVNPQMQNDLTPAGGR